MFVLDGVSASCYSDSFKDAYGFRPTNITFRNREEYEAEVALLNARVEIEIENDRMAEVAAWDRFLIKLDEIVETGAANRGVALRWLIDSEEMFGDDLGFVCYIYGIGYSKEADLKLMLGV